MAVVAVPVVGDEHIGVLLAQDRGQPLPRLDDVGQVEAVRRRVLLPAGHARVGVAEPGDALRAEHRRRRLHLLNPAIARPTPLGARSSGDSPSSPSVATTITTRWPSAAARAIEPPVVMASSSGWAWRNTSVDTIEGSIGTRRFPGAVLSSGGQLDVGGRGEGSCCARLDHDHMGGHARRRSGGRPRRRAAVSARRGSSASATRRSRARPAAGPATPTTARRNVDALGADRVLRQRGRTPPSRSPAATGRSRPRLHRRRRQRDEPRVLGRADATRRRRARRLQARPRLLQRPSGRQGQALMLQQFADDAQRQGRDGADRREQLRLRRHRAGCIKDFLLSPSWWHELLQRRLEREGVLHDRRTSHSADRPTSRARSSTCARRCSTPATPTARTRSSCRRTRRRCRAARGSATRSRATPGRRPAVAASGTTTPTGPTTPRSPTIDTRCATAPRRPALPQLDASSTPERARRSPAVREHRRPARGEGRRELDQRRRGRQDRVGQPGPHRRPRSSARTSCRRTCHPNYWGQLALRNCLRQAYNGGAPRGGTCTPRHGPQRPRRAEHDVDVILGSLRSPSAPEHARGGSLRSGGWRCGAGSLPRSLCSGGSLRSRSLGDLRR